MNVEATELKAIEQATETQESLDILALSFDDLDVVGGGTSLGTLI